MEMLMLYLPAEGVSRHISAVTGWFHGVINGFLLPFSNL